MVAEVVTHKFAEIAPRIWTGSATDEELSKVALADVLAIKGDGEHMHFRANVRARNSADLEARTVEHVASDESADRMGDIIRVKGWELGPFKKNPVLLRYHNNESPPLGTVASVTKDRSGDKPALVTVSQFFEDTKQNEEGALLARLVLDGDMPAVSVGFIPLATSYIEDEEERQAAGLGRFGVVYDKAELLELSVVTVPANASALMRKLDSLRERGMVGESLAKATAELVQREFTPSTRTVVAVVKPESGADVICTAWKLATEGKSLDDRVAALERIANDEGLPIMDVVDTATVEPRLVAIEASLAEIKNTLSAELPALRAQLETNSRVASGGTAQPAQPSAKAESGNRGTDPEAWARVLMHGEVESISDRYRGQGT